MALSGSFTTSSVTGFGCTVYTTFSWTGTQSIETNTTRISWTLKSSVDPSGYHRGIRKIYITIGDTNPTTIYTQVYSYDSMLQAYNGTRLASGYWDVEHENNGTKTVKFNVYVNVGNSTESQYNSTATNQSYTLDTIPRASSMTITPSSGYTNQMFSFSITRAVSGFSHTITTTYNNQSYTLRTIAANASVNGSFEIPTGLRTAMKNASATSVTLNIVITTKNGSTTVGTKTYSLPISAPVPTIQITSATTLTCDQSVSYKLNNIDTYLCTYSVKREYDGVTKYNDAVTTASSQTYTNKRNARFEEVILNGPSGTVNIKATVLVGSANLTVVSQGYTVTIPTDTYKPTITVSQAIATTQSYGTGTYRISYLAGYSGFTAKYTVTINGNAPATVSATLNPTWAGTADISSNGNVHTVTVSKLAAATSDYSVTVTFTAKDTRGKTVSNDTQTITVSGYALPVLGGSIVRSTQAGVADGQGTYAKVSVSGSAFTNTNNTNNGKILVTSVIVKYGSTTIAQTASGVTPAKSLIATRSPYTGTTFVITNEYTFTATVTDTMGQTNTLSFVLPKATVTLSLHKLNGVAFGTTAQAGKVVSALPVTGPIFNPVHISTTANTTKYIKININSTKSWMLSFTIQIYSSYKQQQIRISGYQYGNSHWYTPRAEMISSSDNETVRVSFGYDSVNNLWVCVPVNAYYGINIVDVVNGYTQVVEDTQNLFTLTQVDAIPETLQTTITTAARVIGVKGNSESSYRTGNVNITKANIGLGNVTNESTAAVLLKVYPVGAIYISVVNTDPGTLFGGTWARFGTGKVLVGVDTSQTEFNTVEKTGGEKTHTLSIDEMPSHKHNLQHWITRSPTGGQDGFLVYGMNSGTRLENGNYQVATGGGRAHNNLQPYITVYMWKRTA